MDQAKPRTAIITSCKAISVLLGIIGYVIWILIAAILIATFAPDIKDGKTFKIIQYSVTFHDFLIPLLKNVVPTIIGKVDYSNIFAIAGLFLSKKLLVDRFEEVLRDKAEQLKMNDDYAAMKARMHLSDGSKELAPLAEKMDQLNSGNAESRAELLKLFAETKKKLESMVRDVTFLSIDVVGSTDMKNGEEKMDIELTFKEYKQFVLDRINRHGVLKSAWTPDGVMICFPTADEAVKTAKEVIIGLEMFNKNIKSIKTDLKVRCGINGGKVHFDEATPMEEMSDKVIDVAGHMQKYAPHNAIYVSGNVFETLLENRDGFVPANRVIDDHHVYIWEKPVNAYLYLTDNDLLAEDAGR